jgi:hypothetical protein
MGDRGNIGVVSGWKDDNKSVIFLYTHWGGFQLEQTLAGALDSTEGRGRWTDDAYLTRIIFDHLTGGDRGETGFGIANYLPDNEYPVLIVDPGKGQVFTVSEAEARALNQDREQLKALLAKEGETFEEFIARIMATAH